MTYSTEYYEGCKRLAELLAKIKPGDTIELHCSRDCWSKMTPDARMHPECVYRIRPAPCLVNGIEVFPLREEPEYGSEVWIAVSDNNGNAWRTIWHGLDWQKIFLRLGLLHATEESAQAHLDAATSTTRADR